MKGTEKKNLEDAILEMVMEKVREKEEEDDGFEEVGGGQRDNDRDLISRCLEQVQHHDSCTIQRMIAPRRIVHGEGFTIKLRHPASVTSVALSVDDRLGFSASKDGTIFHWDVNSWIFEEFNWPQDHVVEGNTESTKEVLSLAVSTDCRYLATGGRDQHVHLWDIRNRRHIRALPGHNGPVSCLRFEEGTSNLISGSFDSTIKFWNAQDQTYISTLHGHQSEVLSIDSFKKERVLSVGRRDMYWWKVPEDSKLKFQAPAPSLECCCLVSNSEFLSGSEDGSIGLWNILHKTPIHVVKNAHSPKGLSNGLKENGAQDSTRCGSTAHSRVASVAVCRDFNLFASGAGNGSVCLWETKNDLTCTRLLYDLPLDGFVNSLVFARNGMFLIAGVGQEHRLGESSERVTNAKDGVALYSLNYDPPI